MTNSAVILAPESGGWGLTPMEPRYIDATADGHKTRVKPILARPSIRPSAISSAPSGARFRQHIEGGDADIDLDVCNVGLSPLFEASCDSVNVALHSGATLTYDHTFTWGAAGPPVGRSLTRYLVREQRGTGNVDWYHHKGGKVTALELGAGVDGTLTAKWSLDDKTVEHIADPAISPTTLDPDTIFNWTDATIRVGGVQVDWESVGLVLPTGIDVDDKILHRTATRREPTRKGYPELTGTGNTRYDSPDNYDAWIAGDEATLSIVFEDTSITYEGSLHPKLTISIGAIRFTGEDPEISPDNPTMQSIGFEVVDTSSLTMVLQTTDSYSWLD